jgi:hypothetical protein
MSDSKLAEVLERLEARLPPGPGAEPQRTPESLKREKIALELRAKTHKSKRFAYYIAGNQGAYVGGKLYRNGELIQMPVDKLPSYTWKATDARGKELAEKKELDARAEAEELAKLAREDDDERAPLDETEPPADEVEVDDEAAPTPPASPAAKKKAPAAKKKVGRASDTDIE